MNEDKDLEKLINSLMEEAPLEKPSDNFTEMVVAKATSAREAKLKFKPLITKRAFLLWAIVFGSLIFYVTQSEGELNTNVGNYVSSFTEANSWINDRFGQVQLSKKLMYTIGTFGIMIYFQTLLLKRFFNRRLA